MKPDGANSCRLQVAGCRLSGNSTNLQPATCNLKPGSGLKSLTLLTVLALFLATAKPVRAADHVIAYCAQDQVYAEPIFRQFEKETHIKVRAVYDNEAVKTVALANRLLAERHHPICDVFWGNEEMRTRQMAAEGVFRETNGWAAFGYRSRRIVINTNRLSSASAPHSLFELTNATWRGKLAIAYPQFGTTSTYFQVLRQHWGDPAWQSWCRGLATNKPFLVDGNSEVVKAVGRGDAWIGLTDSDDIADGQSEGLPVAALPMSKESLLLPNTVAVVRNAPDPGPAQQLFEYLQNREVVAQLVAARAVEGASADVVSTPTLQADWVGVLGDVKQATTELNQIFLR